MKGKYRKGDKYYGDSVVSKNIDESLNRIQEKINGLYLVN